MHEYQPWKSFAIEEVKEAIIREKEAAKTQELTNGIQQLEDLNYTHEATKKQLEASNEQLEGNAAKIQELTNEILRLKDLNHTDQKTA